MMKFQIILFLSLAVTAGLFADDMDYPTSYRDLGLPEYANATVTELGRDDTSLLDGIAISPFTQDDGAALRALGMLVTLPFGAVFSKNGMRYQLFTNPEGNGLAVHINIHEE